MKKKITIITLILIFLFPLKAYASTTLVEVNVDGDVKKGEEINILVNMKGLEKLYAASVNFNYDKNILKIVDITASDFIKKHSDEIMEIGGEVDTTNNKTSYSFTFLGDKEGINGDGTLAIIKAEVLKDGNLLIGEDSINIKLVKRAGDSVENYDYEFIGYGNEEDVSTENKEENDTNNKDESNNIADENMSIPNTENNNENTTKEEDTSENIEDKVEIANNTNKEENIFLNNILNGNIVESIINNIKNFISGNNSVGILSEEDTNKEDINKESVNKEYNLEENKTNNVDDKEENDKVNVSISKSDNNTDNIDKNDENKVSEDKEENNIDKQDRQNIYNYFIGAILIVVVVYGIYKLKK